MSRNEILEILRSCKKELSAEYGISKIGVFGSVARDEARTALFPNIGTGH